MDVLTLTDATFEKEVLQSDTPVVVDFWAEWCQPCQMVGPVIDSLAAEYAGKIKVGKMNVDENVQAPSNYGVMSIPNIIIFKGGKPVKNWVGVQSKDTFKKGIEEAIVS
jgi:thioredoxin 1